ncbi:MAG: tetratricopeptide repeat protein [Hydrocarboniphaga sp.]|uniref:tetratricopeptide repeat protein n=1 Tax=Hydrocarboniphaga sp. TaxID=2033016 RepID=UPI00263344B6|nr:tetratricopeptide repeat protein [Hydrocarboniphaga sp.]MDB5969526.1 tetratricopeptide repeat protein [Hydrocarboniphaga sp.]
MSARFSFLAELRRRNVYKVGAMYAVAGWLLVQVVTQVFPIFDISALAQRIIVLVIVAGFPVALVLSWIYELTPQGIVKTDEVAADASITRHTGQQLNRAIIGVLLLAVLVLLARLLWPQATPTAAVDPALATPTNDKSIAVLPFENLSDDHANAYFAEGIQDEILTRLAKIGTLRVISRTSTMRYASAPDNLAEIARQLGVANILEGSVQKAGAKVRINVQLIRAAGDSHLWAETYDRRLDDIFGVQGEVAGAIADALGARLSGGARQEITALPTRSAAAYEAYLRGVSLYRRGFQYADFNAATRAFEDAVKADPGFAQAWAMLARGYSLMIFFGVDASDERRAAALHAVETAEQLQPGSLETQSARAYYIYRVQRDYDEAQRRFTALHERWPNDTEVLTVLSYVLWRQGRQQEADAHVEEALRLDPLNVQLHKLQALNAMCERRFDEALKHLARVQAIAPDDEESRQFLGDIYLAQGDLVRAAQAIGPRPVSVSSEDDYVMLARLQRSYAPAIAGLRELLQRPDANAVPTDWSGTRLDLADLQRLAGDAGAAGNYRQVREAMRSLLDAQPDNHTALVEVAMAQAGLGDAPAAFAALDRAAQLVPESKDALLGPAILEMRARLQARFGRRDEALVALRHLLTVPYGGQIDVPITPAQLRLDPDFDGLRDDPRFQQLIAGSAAAEAAEAAEAAP